MKIIKAKVLSVISIFILLVISNIKLEAQNIDPSLLSLKGINMIGVLVEKVNKPLQDSGVKEEEIQKEVVDDLRSADITVLPMAKMQNIPGSPYLYVNIGAVKSKQKDLYAVSLSVQLKQNVVLSRDMKLKYFGATTWSTSNIGLLSTDKLKDIKDYIKLLVDKFLKDFLIANKKNN